LKLFSRTNGSFVLENGTRLSTVIVNFRYTHSGLKIHYEKPQNSHISLCFFFLSGDVESRKADCGVRAGVLIEDNQQFQNGRAVMVATATFCLPGKIVVAILLEMTDVMERN
jgi:hypothetical protein